MARTGWATRCRSPGSRSDLRLPNGAPRSRPHQPLGPRRESSKSKADSRAPRALGSIRRSAKDELKRNALADAEPHNDVVPQPSLESPSSLPCPAVPDSRVRTGAMPREKSRPKLLRLAPHIAILAILLNLVRSSTEPIRDPDTLWHILAGEHLIRTWQFSGADPFRISVRHLGCTTSGCRR